MIWWLYINSVFIYFDPMTGMMEIDLMQHSDHILTRSIFSFTIVFYTYSNNRAVRPCTNMCGDEKHNIYNTANACFLMHWFHREILHQISFRFVEVPVLGLWAFIDSADGVVIRSYDVLKIIPFHLSKLLSKQYESLTLNVRGPSYLGLTRSISWLLMPWLLTQQPWYRLSRICGSWSYLRKDFN